jgi:hypothetical protein
MPPLMRFLISLAKRSNANDLQSQLMTCLLDLALSPLSQSYTNPSTFASGTFKPYARWGGFVPIRYAKARIREGALSKIHPEPHSSVEDEFISMLRFEHRGKFADLLFDRK